MRLDRSFFSRPTLEVAKGLLGTRLVKLEPDRGRLSGYIVETEGYVGTGDLGCHARVGCTLRNASMWGPPGHAYVYFTYGMHWMLNLVTEAEGFPAAVLIRALHPVEGLDIIRQRRKNRPDRELADGPAKLCESFGIDRSFDGADLCSAGSTLFVEEGVEIPDNVITAHPRVGLNSVPEPWKSIPWNFRVNSRALADALKDEES
ncbi:DNA-3-methyladenine glycosylase [bacterium]|nr:MAG: DNA-3-methyladenine glycosylase [bacterium]